MAWVYILKGNRYYIGSTNNLERRLKEHRSFNKAYSAKRIGDWNLAWINECSTLEIARKNEQTIKKWKNAKMIQKLVQGEINL